MKRICSIFLTLCITFSLVACDSKASDPTIVPTIPTADPTEPTAAPTEPTEPEPIVFKQEGPFSREGVPEFMDLLYKKYPVLTSIEYLQERDCYNDTPPNVFEETGVQIFCFEGIPKSILMFDNELYFMYADMFLPPYLEVMTNAIPYDYDGDGVKDLILSFYVDNDSKPLSITVFNPVSKKFDRVYYANLNPCLYGIYITKSEDDGQTLFTVWYVNVKFNRVNGELVDKNDPYLHDCILHSKKYTVTGIAGYLKTVDGSLQFVPYTE